MKFSVTEDMNKVLGEASSVARKYASPESIFCTEWFG